MADDKTSPQKTALEIWKEKLEHLLVEEAKASDSQQAFTIKQGISECRDKIRELEEEGHPSGAGTVTNETNEAAMTDSEDVEYPADATETSREDWTDADEKFMSSAIKNSKQSNFFLKKEIEEQREEGTDEQEEDSIKTKYPNVGTVLVKDGIAIGESWREHTAKGMHAEYGVLKNAEATKIPGSTLYTTLEPSVDEDDEEKNSADKIAALSVKRVVIGILHPDESRRGAGKKRLEEHGVEVQLAPQRVQTIIVSLNNDFYYYHADRNDTPEVIDHQATRRFDPARSQNLKYPSLENVKPVEIVAVGDEKPVWKNEIFNDRVFITAIHTGNQVPHAFRPKDAQIGDLQRSYELEKDWGADILSARLASALGLSCYHHVNIARALMDFGRFPGTTVKGADHMNRYAISGFSSNHLSWSDRRRVLSECYDVISDHMETYVRKSSLMINMHTYDRCNHQEPFTERPHISLLHTPIGYHREKRMPFHVFDPLYPDSLGESTADPLLVARIALKFASIRKNEYEEALREEWDGERFRVGFNHPYELPDGSVEMRSQVWSFFNYLNEKFNAEHSNTVEDPAYYAVWKMLLDTNLRETETAALRSYIHLLRKGGASTFLVTLPDDSHVKVAFADALEAYKHINDFIKSAKIVESYKSDPMRLNSLAIEVRKDLIWRYSDAKKMCLPINEAASAENKVIAFIVGKLREAIVEYIDEDAKSSHGWIPEQIIEH